MSLITVGLFIYYFEPLNDLGVMNISFYIGIIVSGFGIIGLLFEVEKIAQINDSFFSDFGTSLILLVLVFIGWRSLNHYNWINNFTVLILLLISVLMFFGLYRGIFTLLTFTVSEGRNKKDLFKLLLRIVPIIISIIALFMK